MANKIKALLSDMDGTVCSYPYKPYFSSWDALTEMFPEQIKKEWVNLRDFYVHKKELYQEWFNKQVSFLKGYSLKQAENVLFPVPYTRGFREFFYSNESDDNFLKGIVSNGIDIVAKKIIDDSGFDFYYANILETDNNVFTGRGFNVSDLHGKADLVKKIARDNNLSLDEICFIGDNFNDVPVWDIVGLSIAFDPKSDEIASRADYVINDFRELNKFPGLKLN